MDARRTYRTTSIQVRKKGREREGDREMGGGGEDTDGQSETKRDFI